MASIPPRSHVPVEAILLLLASSALLAPALYVWVFGL